ncbi:MAG TPA: hypothetical protein VJ919_13325 [Tangfeifania sp.]|nr:hypothetical protein [Tangfeifania sp.]
MCKPENTFQTVTATGKPYQKNYRPEIAANPVNIPNRAGTGKLTGRPTNKQFILLIL